ncbi:hypothetical protein DFJ74DRAFT_762737 [Hyaloraphidium curvatum]|nr:hypothetical protein DFJ74DRAFT_762737 [Hyaloraphidium curvatum]
MARWRMIPAATALFFLLGAGTRLSAPSSPPGTDKRELETQLEEAAASNPFLRCALGIFNRRPWDGVFVPLFPEEDRPESSPWPEAIYLIQYSPLKQRRDYLRTLLAGMRPSLKLVVGFDREALSPEDQACLPPGPNADDPRTKEIPPRRTWMQLAPGEVSLGAKHYAVYLDVLRRGLQNALVLEDDVALDPELAALEPAVDFAAALAAVSSAAAQLPENYSVFAPGSALAQLNASLTHPRVFPAHRSRCTHAYAVSALGAARMLQRLPMSCAVDWMMNDETRPYNVAIGNGRGPGVWWMEPPVFAQADDAALGRSAIRAGTEKGD